MRIAIITDEAEGQAVGMGTYTLNLVENILKQDKENEYWLVHRKKEGHKIYSMANEVIVPYNPGFPFSTIRNFVTLPRELRKYDFDIVHHPTNIGPFVTKAIWPTKKGKCVETVHDLIPLLFEGTHEGPVRFAFKHLLPRIANNADKIITVSEASKKDIVQKLRINEEKIRVIYEAASEIYFPKKDASRIRKKYGINGDYMLFVGALEPKKNITSIIKAFSQLKKKGMKHKLVLAGKKGWYYNDIMDEIKKQNIDKEVIFPGYIPLEDMPYIYSASTLFCFPSLYEGFGLPILEAMSCGVPVIGSNRGSIPEIAGNAGVIVDPLDWKKMAIKMEEIATDQKLRQSLKRKGIEQAKKFSWKKAAKETISLYSEVSNA